MKSILITSNAYYPNIGGIENSLRYLATSYVAMGFHVDVVVSDVNLVTSEILTSVEEFEGVTIHRYTCHVKLAALLRPVRGLFTALSMYRLMARIATERKPELTISRFHTNTIIARLAGLNNIVYLLPGVVRFQNRPDNLSTQTGIARLKQLVQFYLHDSVQQLAMRLAHRLAVFSLNMQQQVARCFVKPPRLQMVKPGVDTQRFVPPTSVAKVEIRSQLDLPQDKPIILAIGRFVSAKGFKYVIEAMTELPLCHLVLVGGGEEEAEYRQLCADFGIESQITFAGVAQDPVMYYQSADIFVMPSVYEPLGQTILEALACGLPVVAFSAAAGVVTATEELLDQDQALFVNNRSAHCLGQSIAALLTNKIRMAQLSTRSRIIACERFSWSTLAARLLMND